MATSTSLFASTGWRKTAIINTIIVFIFAIFLMILLVWTSTKAGGIGRVFIFFQGDCALSRKRNFAVHFILNCLSTGIIASSNFFMQVLNSPSRIEADKAHERKEYVEIGVPSIRNAWHVSPLKTALWTGFCLSSVPIHLFFNSAIFETDFRGSHWDLTIAAESFLNGSQYFAPGASLVFSGKNEVAVNIDGPSGLPIQHYRHSWELGDSVKIAEYLDPDSRLSQTLSHAATDSPNWKRLNLEECQAEYVSYKYRDRFRNLVVVVRTKPNSTATGITTMKDGSGWSRSAFLGNSTFWDNLVPANASNSLWFSARCSVYNSINRRPEDPVWVNSCSDALGLQGPTTRIDMKEGVDTNPGLANDTTEGIWTYHFVNIIGEPKFLEPANRSITPESFPFSSIGVKYCLAQEIPPLCKLGLSNLLLLIVTLCVAIKAGHCVFVVLVFQDDHHILVTPGDAIASYLATPDPCTIGCDAVPTSLHRDTFPTFLLRGSSKRPHRERQRWTKKIRRPSHGIPFSPWLRAHAFLVLALFPLFISLWLALSAQALSSGYVNS
ncbi:hypothetical protein B0H63DRAFT_399057 [Podospora didyma]|uniref:DUF6536 domain-containing protein n=1 Tax=Podospora didyma TaxID=330526 RepID=A0AAE0KJQ6_9PEZI|nr:hypothetical protein B0H63DRAFT_399057 [Podospora didyma]